MTRLFGRVAMLVVFVGLVGLGACGSSGGHPDAGPGGDGQQIAIDAFGGANFGKDCKTSDDCGPGGYCVENNGGDVCTTSCDAGCPDGWNCRASDVAGSLVSLCVPVKLDYCKPCTGDAQCNGGVCVKIDGEGYCLPDCPFEGACPTGYSCKPDPSGEHQNRNLCVPDTGSCSCSASNAGQKRTCQTTDPAGTCYGIETCMPGNGGWTGCTAKTASLEVCDGADNDCDQLIDDGLSGSSCGITNSYGTCPGVQVCNGASYDCTGTPPAMEACDYNDNNCNGMTDETWPELSTSCSDGIGGCQRFGVFRCNSAGTGTECSATKGPTSPELCNGLDDDCNGATDEPFKTGTTALGASCTMGNGACMRQGNYVCNSNGTMTTCSVMPGPTSTEACNLVDDDCDNKVDEDFKNLSGQYNQNTHCGSCSTDCTVLYALPNASGACVISGSPQCQLVCATNAFNVNGQTADGCELVLDPGAIYVSKDDAAAIDNSTCGLGPVGTGTGNYPCKTITYGLGRATATGRTRVRVANGNYGESVTLVNGKSVLGGHRTDNWQRDVAGTSTVISGVSSIAPTNHDYTVQANNITSATTFEGFVVIGSVNAKTRGNSYAIYVTGSSANLSIINNVIYGGRGGPGTNGSTGGAGTLGVDGTGRPSNPTGYDAKVTTGTGACDTANNRQYTNGGVLKCGAALDDVSGGNGGGNKCAPRPSPNNELSAIDGLVGLAGNPTLGGLGGTSSDAGDDSMLASDGNGANATAVCLPPTNLDYGVDGKDGDNGGDGSSGAGCSSVSGAIVSGHWEGSASGTGADGGNGGGGSGGAGGGGAKCAAALEACKSSVGANCAAYFNACLDGHDRLGAHGGGGGSGGCGGVGGTGATSGGGAFAIFIIGGTAPIVTGNTLLGGEGGAGGVGGAGGAGGPGGLGAAGGTTAVFCAYAAGRGGNGGDGGNGAGGGGGCGGASFGVYTSGIGAPNYCMSAAANSFSGGAGGAGGAGGYSLINTGAAGNAGIVAACKFN